MTDSPNSSSVDSDAHTTAAEPSVQLLSAQAVIVDTEADNTKGDEQKTQKQVVGADLRLYQFSELLAPDTPEKVNLIKPIALAYLGDVVFELYVRSRLLYPPKRIRDYHKQVVSKVNAESQSHYVDVLIEHLTASEKDLLRRGRNATTGKNRRAKGQDYQKATGLEALIGFLYLSDLPRLLELLSYLEIGPNAQ